MAKIISETLQPAVTVPIGTIITAQTTLGFPSSFIFIALTGLSPVILVFILTKTGVLESKDVPRIRTRLKLLTALITLEIVATITYAITPQLQPILTIQIALVITVIVLTLATFYTKVSIHCGVLATFGTLWGLYSPISLAITIPLLLALAWSRINLKAHTLTQTIFGTLIPIICMTITLALL